MEGRNGYPGLMLDFPRGTTVPLSFDFPSMTHSFGEVPTNMTGYLVYLYISKYQTSSETDVEIVLDGSDANSDLVNGVFAGEISDDSALALPAGYYYYTLKYIDPSGRAFIFDMGRLQIFESASPRVAQD